MTIDSQIIEAYQEGKFVILIITPADLISTSEEPSRYEHLTPSIRLKAQLADIVMLRWSGKWIAFENEAETVQQREFEVLRLE